MLILLFFFFSNIQAIYFSTKAFSASSIQKKIAAERKIYHTYNSNKLDTVPYQKFPVSIVNFTSILEITKKKIKNKIF